MWRRRDESTTQGGTKVRLGEERKPGTRAMLEFSDPAGHGQPLGHGGKNSEGPGGKSKNLRGNRSPEEEQTARLGENRSPARGAMLEFIKAAGHCQPFGDAHSLSDSLTLRICGWNACSARRISESECDVPRV